MRKIISTALVVLFAGFLFSLTACSEAEAVETNIYGSINYKVSNDEDTNGKHNLKAENNSSYVGIDASEGIGEGITGFAKLEVGVDTDDSNNNPFEHL